MKATLLILFFAICTGSHSQISFTIGHRSATSNCNGAGVVGISISDIAFTEGRLYILTVWSDSSNNFATLSGVSETFTPIAQLGGFSRKLSVYRMMPTATTTTQDLTINWSFGNFPAYVNVTISEISGVPIGSNGENAIRQIVIDSNTSADPVLTFSGMGNSSAVFSAFENGRNPFGGTPESGWTENADGGCATFSGSSYIHGAYIMSRTSTNDNTATVTATSSTWRGIGLLFNPSRRATSITN